jgi:hypothetical protein
MIVAVSNQHRSREAFCLFLEDRKERFERLPVWVIWRILEIRTSVKTQNNRGRIQVSSLGKSLAQPCYGRCRPSSRGVIVAGGASREGLHTVLASHQMYGREDDAVISPTVV